MKNLSGAVAIALCISLAANASALEDSLELQEKSDSAAATSQARIDTLADTAARDLQRFRLATQRLDSLSIYNQQLKRLIESQDQEIASISRQTDEIESIETGALPLMIEMTEALQSLISADVPFLVSERETRVEKLRALIDRADVTAGEKFRRIMEAYLVEVDYGRTIEAYRGEIQTNNEVRTVDFLRIGRVGLYYQTLDGSESGRWDPGLTQFQPLSDDFRREIQVGLRVARNQAPPELLSLPVDAPEASL